MNFISTKSAKVKSGFREAVFSGLAEDGGLYVPEDIPGVDLLFKEQLSHLNIYELAFRVLYPYMMNDLKDQQLREIITSAFSFDIPLKKIGNSKTYVLELFHGPTWAFKDFGARFLAGCLSAWQEEKKEVTILVATSGDTGGAVANGFLNQKGTRVVVLYPKGRLSPLQEQQIAGHGGNIIAFAVEGDFDDCQNLVKMAFNDTLLRQKVNIISANSMNIARWLPQMIFYAVAWKGIRLNGIEPVISIPSGNYGNISAAFLLHRMGFTFQKIIAAHNANDTIPRFLSDGIYQPTKTINTLANAMDVNDPSNFVRLKHLLHPDLGSSEVEFLACSVSDEQILEAIRQVWNDHGYLLDPHTATAWHTLGQQGAAGIIVATAHPYKFESVIKKALGFYPQKWNKSWQAKKINSTVIPADYKVLREKLSPA